MSPPSRWPQLYCPNPVLEATVFWQLDNYHEQCARDEGRDVVRLNMDESPVAVVPQPTRGCIVRQRCPLRHAQRRLRATTTQQRTNLTLVAFVTDDVELQPYLPQFVIGSTRTSFTARAFRRLFRSTPENIFLLRGPSGWNSHVHMVTIVQMVARVCRQARPHAAFLLSMDMANCHLHHDVLRELQRQRIRVVLVPTKMTWLLAPLDVSVFGMFKEYFRQAFQDAVALSGESAVSIDLWLPVLCTAIQRVICGRDWSRVFRGVGLGDRQASVKNQLCAELEVPRVAQVSSDRLTERALLSILPAGRVMSTAQLQPANSVGQGSVAHGNVLRIPFSRGNARYARWMLPVATRLPGGTRDSSQSVRDTPPAEEPLSSTTGAQASWPLTTTAPSATAAPHVPQRKATQKASQTQPASTASRAATLTTATANQTRMSATPSATSSNAVARQSTAAEMPSRTSNPNAAT